LLQAKNKQQGQISFQPSWQSKKKVFICTWIVHELSVFADGYNYSHDVLQHVCLETASHKEIIQKLTFYLHAVLLQFFPVE